jgi:hypothetical protein
MVKKPLVIAFIALLTGLNVVLIIKLSATKAINERILRNVDPSVEERIELLNHVLFLNYELSGLDVDSAIPYNFNDDSLRIELYYSTEVCEVCEEDVFSVLVDYIKKYPNKFIAVVPEAKYSYFVNSCFEHRVNIQQIIPCRKDLIPALSLYRRVVFFTIKSNSSIDNIYIPQKPLIAKELSRYLDIVVRK